MPSNNNHEDVFLQIGFRSPYTESKLRTIELYGVPGEKVDEDNYRVSEKIQKFFDDQIARKLFHHSLSLQYCDFEYLKVWLYNSNQSPDKQGYRIPTLDNRDLKIPTHINSSKLECIYVLDNQLEGKAYMHWERSAKDLFKPLFGRFMAPPTPPDVINNVPFLRLAGEMAKEISNKIDPFFEMRKNIFFNALIIQID